MSTKNILSIDIDPDYIICAIYNKQKNISEFIKINKNEFIKPILYFENNKIIISEEPEQTENKTFYNDFINNLLTTPNQRKIYPINFIGDTFEMNDLCLLYFYFNEIIKLAEEKGEINHIIISIPDHCEETETIKYHLYSTFKRIGNGNVCLIPRSVAYLSFMSILDKNKKGKHNYIIIEANSEFITIIAGFIDNKKEDKQRFICFDRMKTFSNDKQSEIEWYLKDTKIELKSGNIILVKRTEEKLKISFVEEKEEWYFRAMKNPNAICAVSGCTIVKTQLNIMNTSNENKELIPIYSIEEIMEMYLKQNFEKIDILNQMNEKINLLEGILEVKIWSEKYKEEYEDNNDYNDLVRIVKEIDEEKDYSHCSYEDIRYLLKPFQQNLPLKLKRQFNLSTMDYYSIYLASMHFESIDDHVNLVLSSSKFDKNMEKFHYNPMPLNSLTRSFFPNLQTLYVYHSNDMLFKNDKSILKRQICFSMNPKYISDLEKVTVMKVEKTIFDSNEVDWSKNNCLLYKSIENKNNLAFVIEDENNNVFGIYCSNNQFPERGKNSFISFKQTITDPCFFILNSQIKMNHPIKIALEYCYNSYNVSYPSQTDSKMIDLLNITLMKKNTKIQSSVSLMGTYGIHAQTIRKLFNDSTSNTTFYFTPKRIVVFEMKEREHQHNEPLSIEETIQDHFLDLERNFQRIHSFGWITNRFLDKIIFDSFYDDWKINSSVFNDRIIGKEHLLMLFIHDHPHLNPDYMYSVGYYFDNKIEGKLNEKQVLNECSFRFVTDQHCSLYESINFNLGCSIELLDKSDKMLINIPHIEIGKQGTNLSKLKHNSFDIDFRGDFYRFVVIQMK